MKKITCIQQYVIDNLIEDEILSTDSLLGAVSTVYWMLECVRE